MANLFIILASGLCVASLAAAAANIVAVTRTPAFAGAFLFSKDNKLLLGRSIRGGVYPDCWIVPGGGVEPDETNLDTLKRETKEETGIDIELDRSGTFCLSFYENEGFRELYERQIEEGISVDFVSGSDILKAEPSISPSVPITADVL